MTTMGLKINLNSKSNFKDIEKQLESCNPNEEVVFISKSPFSWSIIEGIFKKFYEKFRFVVETTGLYNFYKFMILKGKHPFKLVILYDFYNDELFNGERSCYKTFQSILAILGKQKFTVRFIFTELNKKFFNESFLTDLKKNKVEIEYA